MDGSDAGLAEATAMLKKIEKNVLQIGKQIQVYRKTADKAPAVMVKLGKLARQLASYGEYLEKSFTETGPLERRVKALKVLIRKLTRNVNAAFGSGADEAAEGLKEKKKAEVTTSLIKKAAETAFKPIKPLSASVDLGVQLVIIGELLFKGVRKIIRRSRKLADMA